MPKKRSRVGAGTSARLGGGVFAGADSQARSVPWFSPGRWGGMATVRTVAPGTRSRAWAAWAAEWVRTVSARSSRARVSARIGRALGHVDGLLAGVEPAGVLGAPRLDDHVVPGRGEAVGEFGGVPGAAALVGVRGADQGDFHVRERTIRSASSAREARIIPVTKIRIVSLAKCSGCTTRS